MSESELLRTMASMLDEAAEILESKELLSVFTVAQLHHCPYAGKKINTDELRSLATEGRIRAEALDGAADAAG